MLNQIGLTNPVLFCMGDQLPHHIQLVITRKKQRSLTQHIFATAIQPHKMLDDIGHALLAEHLLPQIGTFMAVRIGWIPCTKIIALVEGQEKRTPARQPGSHINLICIHCHMHQATPEMQ